MQLFAQHQINGTKQLYGVNELLLNIIVCLSYLSTYAQYFWHGQISQSLPFHSVASDAEQFEHGLIKFITSM